MLLSFLLFMLFFAIIGTLAVFSSKRTTADYLMAGRTVKPWLAGLSAVATNNSGYMFIGMIGFTYTFGWSSVWLMFGWIVGDVIASYLIMRKLRNACNHTGIESFGGILSLWYGKPYPWLRRVSGLLVVIFLGAYAAAQLKAGGKALHVLLGWEMTAGALMGAALILLYSYAGGLRASIWTDAAQSFVMLLAMIILAISGVKAVGGWEQAWTRLDSVTPHFMGWFPPGDTLHAILFVTGWLFGGFAVAGQPHIIVRYMSLDSVAHLNRFRVYYYLWYTAFYTSVIFVGLLARLLLPDTSNFDAELALPTVALALLPPPMVGIILAGLFAATISTADSLVLSCSAAITQDLTKQPTNNYRHAKLATLVTVILALCIALIDNQSVFRLVLVAWGLLGSAFAPLLVVFALEEKPSEREALTVMAAGVVAFFGWRYLGLGNVLYEVAPGILFGLATYTAIRALRKKAPHILPVK